VELLQKEILFLYIHFFICNAFFKITFY